MHKKRPELNTSGTPNRLINEASTYLRQHAYNPVNWYPWSKEALEAAISQDKPIFLSIGYSACHWCHVMEEESFEDIDSAKLLNENFIPVKVDREERPDIDDIYMSAVQLMTGQGGWPLSVFLTPDQKPFYGGTYFPKEDRHYGQHVLPGFKTVLKAVVSAWQNERHNIEHNGKQLTAAINSLSEQMSVPETNETSLSPDDLLVDSALKILPLFDLKYGGIGKAPKFPQTMCLQMCLQAAASLNKEQKDASPLLNVLYTSLSAMAKGGIYDHLAGGFARYSTDEKWLIPHFEKMLYDNALLAELYFDAFLFQKEECWKNIACQTLNFISSELRSDEGGFYSSLDADSEGEEGRFYVWKKSEVEEVLGSDSDIFCQVYGITEEGNFDKKENVLFLSQEIDIHKKTKVENLRAKLLARRNKRPRPNRDEKILTSWTSLAISAFVKGYQATGNKDYLQIAVKATQFILKRLMTNGKLKRSYAKGNAKINAYLDDYAYFCKALIDLSGIDDSPQWLSTALQLENILIDKFYDTKYSDFYYTAVDHEQLITRPKNHADGPMPAATSIAVLTLFKLSLATYDNKFAEIAQKTLKKYESDCKRNPIQYANMITTSNLCNSDPLTLLLVTDHKSKIKSDMLSGVHKFYLPQKTIFLKDKEKSYDRELKLFEQKGSENQSEIYICRNYTCEAPINDSKSLKERLSNY